jgi:hypothetical protein
MRYVYGVLVFALVLFVPSAQRALADVGGTQPTFGQKPNLSKEWHPDYYLSNRVLEYCRQHRVTFPRALAQAKLLVKAKHDAPAPPPVIIPPCRQCGDKVQIADADRVANDYINKESQPESDLARELIDVAAWKTEGQSHVHDLNPAAAACYDSLDPSGEAPFVVSELADHLYQKADEGAHLFHKDATRAYAGIKFLLATARNVELFGGETTGALAAAGEWARAVVDQTNKRIFTNHEYGLCPGYLAMYRELALLGLPADDVAYVEQNVHRIHDFLHFQIHFTLHEVAHGGQGELTDISWSGHSSLSFDLNTDQYGGCYTPKMAPDHFVVHVDSFTMHGHGGNVYLQGPTDFEVALSGLHIPLCDSHPNLDFTISDFGPASRLNAKGNIEGSYLFEEAMLPIMYHDRKAAAVETNQLKSKLASLQAEVKLHANDQSWMMAHAADIMRQVQVLQNTNATSGPQVDTNLEEGVALGKVGVQQLLSVPWFSGTPDPVDKTIELDKGTTHITFHMSVVNDPQNGSESDKYKAPVSNY